MGPRHVHFASFAGLLTASLAVLAGAIPAAGRELSLDDFSFDGRFGSQGATIEKVGRNHFRVTLRHAPGHTDWCNTLRFHVPEMGAALGPWTDLKEIIVKDDPQGLVKPLKTKPEPGNTAYWSDGPHVQFGISTFLCEGAGAFTTKQQNPDSGVVLMKSVAERCKGIRK